MKEIGGYFEFELPFVGNMPNSDGVMLNTGRNALEFVLCNLGIIETIYIPYFTCDVVLEPIKKLNIKYSFYRINENLEIVDNISLSDKEYLLYTNYYGIKDAYIHKLSEKYSDRLIVDNAQALYAEPTMNCIYSPRKFVGLPDGGIAFVNTGICVSNYEKDESYNRCGHLFIRHDIGASAGYATFRENSAKLHDNPIKQMSNLTQKMISSIDFSYVKKKRIENFTYLHSVLFADNKLNIDNFGNFNCPMVYPYLTDDKTLKTRLIENKIFVATYWPNVKDWCDESMTEWQLADKVIAIPIDQRYSIEDMKHIIKTINNGTEQ